jgi:hypothetical protein
MKNGVFSKVMGLTVSVLISSSAFAQQLDSSFKDMMNGSNRVEVGTRLMLNENAKVRTFGDLENGNAKGSVDLKIGTEMEVLEVSKDGKAARIGIDTNNSSLSDITVAIDDLQAHSLSAVDTDENADDEFSDEELFARKRGGMTYCYRDVKTTLLKSGKCGRYASGVRAAEGYKILARECGMNKVGLDVNLAKLPTYSVCVSGGGRSCGGGTYCGHIAIKMPSGQWFGAGTRGTPWLPNSKKKGYAKRYQIGCLTPKGK